MYAVTRVLRSLPNYIWDYPKQEIRFSRRLGRSKHFLYYQHSSEICLNRKDISENPLPGTRFTEISQTTPTQFARESSRMPRLVLDAQGLLVK